jgi:transposase
MTTHIANKTSLPTRERIIALCAEGQGTSLANGDTVVMDNCGFHHGRFDEAELRRMLENRGVTLIFQPPYSPEFNTCEFSFRLMKAFMRKHKHFSVNFTEMAILRGLEEVTPEICRKFFEHCGFLV